jgi:predicted transcriptional regulator
MTPMRAAVAKFLVNRLGLYQHQAAAILGVNQGRISEVIKGKRHPDVPPSEQLPLDFT